MALEDIRLLLVRPQDLVVTSVRLVGFDVDGDAVTAAAGPGVVEFTLPPQATGELVLDAATGLASARLGGTSRVSFRVAQGTTAPLSAEGILAMADRGEPVSEPAPPGTEPTSVELPWRLEFGPRPKAAGDALLGTFAATPFIGTGGAAGLWHLRLEAASGLALVPLEGDAGDLGEAGESFVPPLHRGQRDRIRAEGSPPQEPPTAPYMDLSSLGGTMSAKGTWPTFAWEQEIVLGRDMVVRTEAKGFLYPWGHRAVLVDVTRRVLTPEAGPATAGLRQHRLLVVPDPVRRRAQDGELARGLPFDEVEVLQPTTEVGTDEVPERFPRIPKRLEQLDLDQAAQEQALADLQAAVAALFDQRIADINANADFAAGNISARFGVIGPRIDELAEIQRAFEEFAASHPEPPVDMTPPQLETEGEPGSVPVEPFVPPEPGPRQLTHAEAVELQNLSDESAALALQSEQIEAARQAQLATPVSEADLSALGGVFADVIATAQQMRAAVPAFAAFVQSIHDQADQRHDVFVWPHARSGGRLMLPIRCDGLRMATPVLFLHDIHFDDNEDFPEFAPLTDPAVLGLIAAAWTGNQSRRLPVPGIPVDLVRSGAAPQPADVLPVHELTIGGRQDGAEFRAVIEEARVALKAVGELVPNLDGLARVTFDPEFLRDGVADKVALRLPDGLGVDFRQAADKAGGLMSPAFTADVLSRLDGPVDARALPGLLPGPPDLSAAFKDATILGIPLGSIVDNVSLPKPLSIVAEPGGGARMSWKDLVLKSHGPFVVAPGTTFELTVVRSPAETLTKCRIENFTLVLPPGGDLVKLHFKALTFLQKPGHPPDLDVDGFRFELGGDLGLLKTLQEKVDLGSAAPTVRSTPTGMRAGYSLAVPEVTAGMFVMRNVAASVGVEVPFDGRPIVTTLAFASREKPFNMSVSIFGGSGYLLFEIAEAGIRKLEASLDFGASVAISVGIAKAEVHALGGVRFLLAGNEVKVTGFLRVGGSVDVLGLVSVSVELRVELAYDGRVLSGRATAVIEIDVTFWSGSIHLDSGEYVFAGAAAAAGPPPAAAIETSEPSLADWQKYRDKFRAA